MFWLDSLVGNLSEFRRIACWSKESSLLNFFLEQSSLLNFFVVFAACEKHCILLMFWLDWLVGNLSKFRQIECSRAAAAEKSKKKNWTELRSARRHKTSHFGRGGAIYNIESCAFLHQQWGSYLLALVILSGMTLPRVVHRTNYFTSLIARRRLWECQGLTLRSALSSAREMVWLPVLACDCIDSVNLFFCSVVGTC